MSRNVKKNIPFWHVRPTKTQISLRIRASIWGNLNPCLSKMCPVKHQTRLRECAGRSEFSVGAHILTLQLKKRKAKSGDRDQNGSSSLAQKNNKKKKKQQKKKKKKKKKKTTTVYITSLIISEPPSPPTHSEPTLPNGFTIVQHKGVSVSLKISNKYTINRNG